MGPPAVGRGPSTDRQWSAKPSGWASSQTWPGSRWLHFQSPAASSVRSDKRFSFVSSVFCWHWGHWLGGGQPPLSGTEWQTPVPGVPARPPVGGRAQLRLNGVLGRETLFLPAPVPAPRRARPRYSLGDLRARKPAFPAPNSQPCLTPQWPCSYNPAAWCPGHTPFPASWPLFHSRDKRWSIHWHHHREAKSSRAPGLGGLLVLIPGSRARFMKAKPWWKFRAHLSGV